VPISASRQLELLQERYANVLAQLGPAHLEMPCFDGRSVQEVIGLVLMDLDRLASGPRSQSDGVPGYASTFMARRLASRWAARYQPETVAAEAERRFAKARATVPDRLTPEYLAALARISELERPLGSAIKLPAPPG
jgi:hypothetical protein